MDSLLEIAAKRSLAVVEDAAQAHGASYQGRRVGGLAHAAAFSFYPSKNLGAFGDGGAVTTADPDIAGRVRLLRNGGQSSRYRHETAGVNSRLDELQAAVLSVRLKHLDADNERRREIAARYTAAVGGVPDVSGVAAKDDEGHSHHLYVVLADDRDAVAEHLARHGVATAVHYPTPIHLQPAFGGPGRSGEHPIAEAAARRVLSLPLYPELTDGEVNEVCAAVQCLDMRSGSEPALE
jgi:dTDP-4-amino-4,6-dideoxygalactose transaminase